MNDRLQPPPDKNPVVQDGRKVGHGDEPPTRGAVAPAISDLLRPGDSVRLMAINGGVEKGGMDISYEKVPEDESNGWLVTKGEDGKPRWTRVKLTMRW